MLITTWFVADRPEEATLFAQMPGLPSSAPAFQATYWRCVAVFFTYSAAMNPEADHVLFTNTVVPTSLDGFALRDHLDDLGVRVVTLPVTYRLPREVAPMWGNQFYVLDIITHLAHVERPRTAVVLDCDSVFIRSAVEMEAAVERQRCLLYTLGHGEHPHGLPINGLPRENLAAAAEQVFPQLPAGRRALGQYHGGELFAATGEACTEIAMLIDELWAHQMLANGERAFLEEAHFLSILYNALGYESGTAESFVKRIWTGLRHRTTAPTDRLLTAWHLPAEKRTGFVRLFRRIADGHISGVTPPDELVRQAEDVFGVPDRSPNKVVIDLRSAVQRRLPPVLSGAQHA